MNEEIKISISKVRGKLSNLNRCMIRPSWRIIEFGKFLSEWLCFFKRKDDGFHTVEKSAEEMSTQDFVAAYRLAIRDLEDGTGDCPKLSGHSPQFYESLWESGPRIAEAIFRNNPSFVREIKDIFHGLDKAVGDEGNKQERSASSL